MTPHRYTPPIPLHGITLATTAALAGRKRHLDSLEYLDEPELEEYGRIAAELRKRPDKGDIIITIQHRPDDREPFGGPPPAAGAAATLFAGSELHRHATPRYGDLVRQMRHSD